MNRVIPKCMRFNLDGTDKDFDQTPQLHADGWMRPCCWLGQQGIDKEEVKELGLLDEELHIRNVKDLDEIFESNQWNNFIDLLYNKQELLPGICFRFCGEDNVHKP